MENQKPKTKTIFKILINTAKTLVVVLALGGIVMLATGTNFEDLTKIFGSKAATASDTLKETWDVAGEVHDIVSTETTTYIGGSFRSVNGVPRKGLAAIDNLTGEVTDWDPNVTLMGSSSGRILEMAIKDRTIYIVGQFGAVDGVERVGIAAINLDATQSGEYLTSWNPPAKVIGYSLAIKDTTLYMTYYWSNSTFAVPGGGVDRYGFMAFDLLAESGDEYYTDWAPNLYDFENDTRFKGRDSFIGREARLLLDGDKLYVYGLSILCHYQENDGTWEGSFNVQDPLFILTTETPESGEYRLDWAPEILSEEQENTRHPDVGNIHSVVLKDNILYISGVFDHVDGQPRQGLAAVRTDASTPGEYVTGWSPSVDFKIDNLDPDGNLRESSPYSYVGVRAMALSGDELYIGGAWDSIDGVETPSDYDNSGDGLGIRSFAALTTDVSAQGDYLLDWRPDSSVRTSSIYTFEIACNILYAGGYTTRYAPMTAYQLDDEGCDSESAPPPPEENPVVSLDSVEISPSVSTLQAGGHETFVTTAYGSDGEVMNDVTYTWTVQGGSTDTTTGDTIIYTASNIAGNYVIQVSATDGTDTVEDTAQVTITIQGEPIPLDCTVIGGCEPEPIPEPIPAPQPQPQPQPEPPLPETGPEDVWMLLALASFISAILVYTKQSLLVSKENIYQNESNGDE
jgi:hypothetical protein